MIVVEVGAAKSNTLFTNAGVASKEGIDVTAAKLKANAGLETNKLSSASAIGSLPTRTVTILRPGCPFSVAALATLAPVGSSNEPSVMSKMVAWCERPPAPGERTVAFAKSRASAFEELTCNDCLTDNTVLTIDSLSKKLVSERRI